MPNFKLKPFKHQSAFRRIAAVAWDEPRDPTIYGSTEVLADRLLEWIDLKRRETGEKITITHAVAMALAMSLRKHPDCNAVVRWGKLQLREDVDIFLQVAVPNEDKVGSADLTGYCVRQADTKDIGSLAKEVKAAATKLRKNEDPDFQRTKSQAGSIPGFIFGKLLRFLKFLQVDLNIDTKFLGAPKDPFGSAMVTSLGMFGVRTAYAPFFPLASTPIIVLVGSCEDRPVAIDGAVVVRKVLHLNATLDHRVVDGFHGAILNRDIKMFLENPRRMEFEGERDHMLGGGDNTTDLETLDLDTATPDDLPE
jgi:pyruvate/2-oxoglutarate dehydrogenase complex dihydrolipoamide acyltransferase (E2) component